MSEEGRGGEKMSRPLHDTQYNHETRQGQVSKYLCGTLLPAAVKSQQQGKQVTCFNLNVFISSLLVVLYQILEYF